MPHSCAAWACSNRCTVQARTLGITFHRFPKEKGFRKQWEAALRRNFTASKSSRICSEHFKQEDFDRTGQTVRLREGVVPSVLNFPPDLRKPVVMRTTMTSAKARQSVSVDCSPPAKRAEPPPLPQFDHSYALPASLTDLKNRLSEALKRVDSLEREKRNAKDRERRAKEAVHELLEYLRGKNLINEELKERLSLYSGPCHYEH